MAVTTEVLVDWPTPKPAYSREDRDKSAEIESGFTIASAADGVIGVTLEGSSYTFRLPPLLVERLRGFLGCVITARLAPVEDGTEHRLLIVGKILPHPTEEEVPMLEEHRHG